MPRLFVSHRQRRDANPARCTRACSSAASPERNEDRHPRCTKASAFPCEPRLKSLPIEHEWHARMQILCAIASAGRDDGEG